MDEAISGGTPRDATDAVAELVALVGSLKLDGWTFTSAVDLRGRTGAGLDPDVDIVPLVLPDGTIAGTLRCPPRPTGTPEDAMLRALLGTVVLLVAMERKGFAAASRASEAERESRLDPLTGLPNRRMWDEEVVREQARCTRHRLEALVAVIDLDDLKQVNDQHGHLAGDVLLRVAAKALKSAVRDTDLVARLGGDEFAVLAVAFDDGDGDGDRFRERLEEALGLSGVAASVGVSVAGPDLGIAAAFDRSDRLMYEVKKARKGA